MPASNTGFDLDAWLSGLLNDLIPALSQLAGSANDQAVEKVVNLALGEEQPKNLYATYPKFGMTNLRVKSIDTPEVAEYDRYDYRRAVVYAGAVIADLILSGGGATPDRSAKLETLLFGTNTSGQDFPSFVEKLLITRPESSELFGEWRSSVEAGLAALSALTARDKALDVDDEALKTVQKMLEEFKGLDKLVALRLKDSIEMGTSSSTAILKRCTRRYLRELGSMGPQIGEDSHAKQG